MNLFQSTEWEQFKLSTGYSKSYRVDDILVLQKSLPFGRSMLYSPMVDSSQKSKVKNQNFISKIKNVGKNENTIFYRLEIDDFLDEANSYQLEARSFIKAFEEMQPEHTLVLDLTQSEEDILKQMKQKGRYNIKVARKHKVKIVEDKDVNNFYNLYSNMAKRHKISYRSRKYFEKLLDIMNGMGYCKVLTAYATNEISRNQETEKPKDCKTPVASVIISFYADKATYLFGGSSDEHRKLMAPYLLQWEAIKTAKAIGCISYDFFGVAPPNAPNHAWRGVSDFKKKFGGEEIETLGSWDLVLRPLEYQVFKIAEKVRR